MTSVAEKGHSATAEWPFLSFVQMGLGYLAATSGLMLRAPLA